jgi:hypothetical protein
MATTAKERFMELLDKHGPGDLFVIESIRVRDGYVRNVIFRKNSISGDFLALRGGNAVLSAGDGSLFIFDGDISIESDSIDIGGMKSYIPAGLKGITFKSNPGEPLTFFLLRKRNWLVYKSGKGQIILPDGRIVTLP